MISVLFLGLIFLKSFIRANIIDGGVMDRVACNGSVIIYEGFNETVITKDEDVKVTLDYVKVEGCGCFTLHSRKGGNG